MLLKGLCCAKPQRPVSPDQVGVKGSREAKLVSSGGRHDSETSSDRSARNLCQQLMIKPDQAFPPAKSVWASLSCARHAHRCMTAPGLKITLKLAYRFLHTRDTCEGQEARLGEAGPRREAGVFLGMSQ